MKPSQTVMDEQRDAIEQHRKSTEKLLDDGDKYLEKIANIMDVTVERLVASTKTLRADWKLYHAVFGHQLPPSACEEDSCPKYRQLIEGNEQLVATATPFIASLKLDKEIT
jgi:hypothetical protein